MIERFIKNDLTLKRWRRFKKIKRAMASVWIFVFLLFISLTAEFWANSKPIFMSFKGHFYMPIYFDYHPTRFGQTDALVTDYRKLEMGDGDWTLWPPVQWDPLETNKDVSSYPSQPTEVNLFGTDDRGRDVLSRLIYGFRFSIGFALMVWFFSYILGVIAGAIMGFAGGRVDLIGQRIVEVFEAIPGLLLLITLVVMFNASLMLLVLFSVAFGWMFISYYIRAEFLRLRNLEFVESARALGASKATVIFKHILPNAVNPIITFSPFNISGSIASLAALDYLGFGLPAPTPSWGELLQQAEKYFDIAWWLAVFPSLALFLSLVVLNLIGEGVRDAFDPRK